MNVAALLEDGFLRIQQVVQAGVEGLSAEQLAHQPAVGANSIGWLVWHLTRVQDDHVADAAGVDQVWTAAGWEGRFGLPFEPEATGYGHSAAEVRATTIDSPELLTGYLAAVTEQTLSYVRGLSADDLDRVVDTAWDPPVTLGVRLISVISDDLLHAGQAAYLRGLAAT